MKTFAQISGQLDDQAIELPSWAFGNSGTRFKVFGTAGTPRTVQEKLADAAEVHRLTGLAPSVALHIPWDRVDDYDKLPPLRGPRGRLGTINSNTFQDDDYKFGSLTHVDERIRHRRSPTTSSASTSWTSRAAVTSRSGSPTAPTTPARATYATGRTGLPTPSPQVYARLAGEQRLVLEYKFFEPAFYATDVPDWGTSFVQCLALGDRAVVCLDTGHHAPGTNIEFIVMQLLRLGRSAPSTSTPASTPTTTSSSGRPTRSSSSASSTRSIRGGGYGQDSDVAFMLDQCHNVEAKIPGQIRSVLNVQEMTARALLVDRDALAEAEATATCSPGTPSSWTRSTPTSAPTSPSGARRAACPPTR